jgi:succinate dehydrogenase / fumarate reductase flavoprotein subunit/L-aspartate oxidase
MISGIPYETAWQHYQASSPTQLRSSDLSNESLLQQFHPDYQPETKTTLQVGPNQGDVCQRQLAQLLQSNALIDELDLAGAPVVETDVLIIGAGGAGCAAALTAAQHGARVILTTKLRLGDSNTVMAEGGLQAAVGVDDTPQQHYDDTLRAGYFKADRKLVAQMVMDGPDVVRWLIQQGMQFDQENDDPFGNLILKRPGGASAPRILSYRDYTGLEMMRVLREAVSYQLGIDVWPGRPVVELLSNELGHCAGAVVYDLDHRQLVLVRASAVILATGGVGRIHLNAFPTSNHFGATGDGLVLAYRLGAKVRDLESFQYHPTGVVYPRHLAGSLVSEAARSAGATLLNGLGERFVDELQPRDVVSAAIIRECREGRGVVRGGQVGVWLDTPRLEQQQPGTLQRFGSLQHLADKCGHDPAERPFLVYPTLHYQNGGVVIDPAGATTVPGFFCAGEVTGGIHGRNRLMGNALLEIISFGRRTGAKAAELRQRSPHRKITIEHVHAWQRALTLAGLPLDNRGPQLFPAYANFNLQAHAAGAI